MTTKQAFFAIKCKLAISYCVQHWVQQQIYLGGQGGLKAHSLARKKRGEKTCF